MTTLGTPARNAQVAFALDSPSPPDSVDYKKDEVEEFVAENLAPYTSKEACYTCPECIKSTIESQMDIAYYGYNPNTDRKRTLNLAPPIRCKKCDRKYDRKKKMVRRMNTLYYYAYLEKDRAYQRPKLITFARPSTWCNNESNELELARLESQLPDAINILRNHMVKGGIMVAECTTRAACDYKTRELIWKHHAHIHMVAISPWMPRNALIEFSELLLPLGLGRINYKAMANRKAIAKYISKYLVKDKRRTRTWGVLRGATKAHKRWLELIEHFPPSVD